MKRIILLVFVAHLAACNGQKRPLYNLSNPDMRHELPAILNEVSGVTDLDASQVACVQDELGIVFIYNFMSGKIISQHIFDDIGDFEGLAYTPDALYILRSDGRLTEWNNFQANTDSIRHYQLSLFTSNNEGLCFDPRHNRLLIAAKSKPHDPDDKSKRYIYSYDLTSKKLKQKPLYKINVSQLENKARKFNSQQTETNAKGKTKPFNFRPSSLSVHPLTDDIYIISAADKLLVVLNREGEVTYMERLNAQLYTKAEGITFLPDGTMIITNEAAGKKPGLLVFKMNTAKK